MSRKLSPAPTLTITRAIKAFCFLNEMMTKKLFCAIFIMLNQTCPSNDCESKMKSENFNWEVVRIALWGFLTYRCTKTNIARSHGCYNVTQKL